MSNEIKLVADPRESKGSRASQKLRSQGRVPGTLYGLGGETLSFTVAQEALSPLVFNSTKIVGLELDGKSQITLFREVQWDTFGKEIWHIDLQRIDPTKRLTVDIVIEIRGSSSSPGLLGGGVLDKALRSVSIECLAHQIPEHVYARINDLNIGDALHISDLEVPEGTAIMDDPETLVARINAPVEESELDDAAESAIEPELVGRQPDAEEGD